MIELNELLNKYWGYSSFLPLQKEIIDTILKGHDTLAIMATGSGKSLCYQLPALSLGGLTIVISPLISLMKDQVDDLNARGIPAAAFNSSLDYRDREKIEIDIKNSNIRMLFVSPEKCMQPNFLEYLKKFPISLIAIDEAHCISEWGHNFRPEYRQLSALKMHFPSVPMIALTASAIPEVRKDISKQLGLLDPCEFVGSFNRKNLQYRILPKKESLKVLLNYVEKHKDDSGIIYCLSKKETEDIANGLQKSGYKALAYHAGLPNGVREKIQDEFIHDNINIICATVAFGMGIDKPDVRYVIHYDLPKSVESYYQETGRAGRDGEHSECILFYSRGDTFKIRTLLERDGTDERQTRMAIRKLQDMVEYCESPSCRRKYLLNYFGEEYFEKNCGLCDNCDNPKEMIGGKEIAKKIIECVKQLPSNFGVEIIADVLIGSKSSKIKSYNLEILPVYNSANEYPKSQLKTWINELVSQGYLTRAGDKYPVIRLTNKSNEIFADSNPVLLSIPDNSTIKRFIPQDNSEMTSENAELFLKLKSIRKSIADHEGVPPYVIFQDTVLKEMVQKRPEDLVSFGNIVGVGEYKLEKYGPVFTSAIKNFGETNKSDIQNADNNREIELPNSLERIYQFDREIFDLTNKLKELKATQNGLFDLVVKSGITQQGKYILQSSISQVRQLNLEAFKQLYPKVFLEIGSVRLRDADEAIGKEEVTDLCTIKESTRYVVLDTESEK